jgi:hypothetical protein
MRRVRFRRGEREEGLGNLEVWRKKVPEGDQRSMNKKKREYGRTGKRLKGIKLILSYELSYI